MPGSICQAIFQKKCDDACFILCPHPISGGSGKAEPFARFKTRDLHDCCPNANIIASIRTKRGTHRSRTASNCRFPRSKLGRVATGSALVGRRHFSASCPSWGSGWCRSAFSSSPMILPRRAQTPPPSWRSGGASAIRWSTGRGSTDARHRALGLAEVAFMARHDGRTKFPEGEGGKPLALTSQIRSKRRRTTRFLSIRNGLVAEWLRRGLQILAPRFDSGRGLHSPFLSQQDIPRPVQRPKLRPIAPQATV